MYRNTYCSRIRVYRRCNYYRSRCYTLHCAINFIGDGAQKSITVKVPFFVIDKRLELLILNSVLTNLMVRQVHIDIKIVRPAIFFISSNIFTSSH